MLKLNARPAKQETSIPAHSTAAHTWTLLRDTNEGTRRQFLTETSLYRLESWFKNVAHLGHGYAMICTCRGAHACELSVNRKLRKRPREKSRERRASLLQKRRNQTQKVLSTAMSSLTFHISQACQVSFCYLRCTTGLKSGHLMNCANIVQGLVPHTTSTKTTTVGAAEAIERGSSTPIHPAVQQMEDNDDMLFGDHPDYEYMTPEQQVKWKAEAPARLQKRLLEEEEEEDNGGEGPAKKTPRKK